LYGARPTRSFPTCSAKRISDTILSRTQSSSNLDVCVVIDLKEDIAVTHLIVADAFEVPILIIIAVPAPRARPTVIGRPVPGRGALQTVRTLAALEAPPTRHWAGIRSTASGSEGWVDDDATSDGIDDRGMAALCGVVHRMRRLY
jgi:hypothetical protein